MNTALVDLDGTLADYNVAVETRLENIFGVEGRTKLTGEQYKKLTDLIKQVPGFWRELPKIELGFKLVGLLVENGFDLHILTKGPYKTTAAWSEKVEWCRKYLPKTPVTITEDKGLMYGRVLCDDWPEYCERWLKWRPRGLVIMPAHPYNEGFDLLHPKQVVRATGANWDVVGVAIKKAAIRLSMEGLDL